MLQVVADNKYIADISIFITDISEKFNSLWHYWRFVDKDDLGGHGAINGLNLIKMIQ